MSKRKYYNIILYDTKQDGWNNNSLSIKHNDKIIAENITLLYNDYIDDINSKIYKFHIDSEDSLFEIIYSESGFYSYENYYELYSGDNLIYSSPYGEKPPNSIIIDNKSQEPRITSDEFLKNQICFYLMLEDDCDKNSKEITLGPFVNISAVKFAINNFQNHCNENYNNDSNCLDKCRYKIQ